MNKHLKLLKQIQNFLNVMPNTNKYGPINSYILAEGVDEMIKDWESKEIAYKIVSKRLDQEMVIATEEVNEKQFTMQDVKHLFITLRKDAEMALNGEWDRSDKGFQCQIEAIDNILLRIKNQ